MKIYSLYDKVSKKHLSITLSTNDADFIRSSLYAILMDYPIQDVEAYCVGDFFEDNGIVIPCSPRLVDWNSYKFPKNADSLEEEYLSFDDLRQSALAKKKQFDEQRLDKIEDFKKIIEAVDKELQRNDLSDKQITDLKDYKKMIQDKINSMEVA